MNTKMNNNNNKKSNPHGIVDIKDLDMNKITFSDMKVNPKGGHMVNIYYDGKPFLLKLPKLRMQWGAQAGQEKYGKENDYDIAALLGTLDNNPVVEECRQKLLKLDELVVKYGIDNYKNILKKLTGKETKEVIEAMIASAHSPIVKKAMKDNEPALNPEGKPYSDSMRIKLPRDLSNKNLLIGDNKGNILNETTTNPKELFPPASNIIAINRIFMWVVSCKIGISVNLVQALVSQSTSNKLTTFNLIDPDQAEDSDDDEEEEEEVDVDVGAEDSDVENSDQAEDSEEEVPEPVPESKPEPEPEPVVITETKKPVKPKTVKGKKKTEDLLKAKLSK